MFDALFEWIYELFYSLDTLVCRLLYLLYSVFEIFAGIKKVKYDKNDKYLINIFFDNSVINRVYWGMALIAVALCFGFTIMIVIKKMFDQSDKVKGGYGDIIRNGLKSILMILLMQFIMLATITMTNTLLQAVSNLFTFASASSGYENITFTSEDYATMARILNKIGNYSVNPSSRSRYNINTCYNDIRQDMLKLQQKHIFDHTYEKKDANGQVIESWQSVLSAIARSHNLSEEADIDAYDTSLVTSVGHAMDVITTSGSNFKPLTEQTWVSQKTPLGKDVRIDRIMFLTGSTSAAKNSDYNKNATLFDACRYPFLSGEKDIYDLDDVKDDFEINFDFNHLLVIVGGLILCKQFLVLALNCVARIFNMMLLYIMAPPFLAAMPYDEGGKTKQWTTAFVVQSLSVFGSVVSVRLLMIFVPVIFDNKIELLGGGFAEIVAKVVFLFGAAFTCNKASAMISGILADSAGLQSVQAGDVGSGAAAKMGAIAKKGTSIAAKPITAPLGAIGSRAGKEMGDALYSGVKKGGAAIAGGIGAGFKKLGNAMGIGGSKKGGSKAGEAGKKSSDSKDSKDKKNSSDAKKDANTLGVGSGSSGGKDGSSGSGPQNNSGMGKNNSSGGKEGSGSEPKNNNSAGDKAGEKSSAGSGGEEKSSSGSEPQNNNGMGDKGSDSGSGSGGDKSSGGSGDSDKKKEQMRKLFGDGYEKSIQKGQAAKAARSQSKGGAGKGGSQPQNNGSVGKGGGQSQNKGAAGKGGNKDLSNLFGKGYDKKAGGGQPQNKGGAGGGKESKSPQKDGDAGKAEKKPEGKEDKDAHHAPGKEAPTGNVGGADREQNTANQPENKGNMNQDEGAGSIKESGNTGGDDNTGSESNEQSSTVKEPENNGTMEQGVNDRQSGSKASQRQPKVAQGAKAPQGQSKQPLKQSPKSRNSSSAGRAGTSGALKQPGNAHASRSSNGQGSGSGGSHVQNNHVQSNHSGSNVSDDDGGNSDAGSDTGSNVQSNSSNVQSSNSSNVQSSNSSNVQSSNTGNVQNNLQNNNKKNDDDYTSKDNNLKDKKGDKKKDQNMMNLFGAAYMQSIQKGQTVKASKKTAPKPQDIRPRTGAGNTGLKSQTVQRMRATRPINNRK